MVEQPVSRQGAAIPAYLHGIAEVVADRSMAEVPLTERVRSRLPEVPFRVLEPGETVTDRGDGGQVLYIKEYKGRFLRFCPGTRYYRCCGYRIIHIGENCPLRCSYCILQAYFQDRVLKVWANQEDLFTELDKAFGTRSDHRFRVGTGEFTDSLVLESVTGYSRDLVKFLSRHENV